ncbi:hypothetical protein AMECASPLE_004584 [Ameca splendens]|uniref:Uncharacterized protein n=1 Tax=Ameca splendens TaxID=208324 RepID=A0ABV0XBY4_9TELE
MNGAHLVLLSVIFVDMYSALQKYSCHLFTLYHTTAIMISGFIGILVDRPTQSSMELFTAVSYYGEAFLLHEVDGKMDGAKYNPQRKPVRGCKKCKTGTEVHLPVGQQPQTSKERYQYGLDQSLLMC